MLNMNVTDMHNMHVHTPSFHMQKYIHTLLICINMKNMQKKIAEYTNPLFKVFILKKLKYLKKRLRKYASQNWPTLSG
jgi:hypothetical protein